jgi:hypothetical protein
MQFKDLKIRKKTYNTPDILSHVPLIYDTDGASHFILDQPYDPVARG